MFGETMFRKQLEEKLPERIVIDGAYFWEQFDMPSLTFKLGQEDAQTILYDIITKFLTMNDPDVADFAIEIPDFNRMRDKEVAGDTSKVQEIIQAAKRVEEDLFHTFSRLNTFNDKNQFSYAFERFLGKDIVINKLSSYRLSNYNLEFP
jgi:hypothetical protein